MEGAGDVQPQCLAYAVEPYTLTWLEDLVPLENIETMSCVADRSTTPISGCKNYYLSFGFREVLERHVLQGYGRGPGTQDLPSPD